MKMLINASSALICATYPWLNAPSIPQFHLTNNHRNKLILLKPLKSLKMENIRMKANIRKDKDNLPHLKKQSNFAFGTRTTVGAHGKILG